MFLKPYKFPFCFWSPWLQFRFIGFLWGALCLGHILSLYHESENILKGVGNYKFTSKKKNLLFGILFKFLLLFNPFDSNISLMQFTFLFHLYWENYACLIYYIYLRIHVILGFFNYIKYTNYYMQYSCTSVLCNKTPCVS